MSDIFVSKVSSNSNTYYLKLRWNQNVINLFELQIFGDGDCWSGTFTNDVTQKAISDLDQTEEEYFTNTKKCLIGNKSDEFMIDIKLSEDRQIATLSWKKRFDNFFQQQGLLILHRDISESKDSLIDFLIDKNEELKSNIELMDQKTEEINTELAKCKSELENFINMKTTVESTLYGKFVQLLNAKKQRIQLLEAELQKLMN